MESEPAVDFSSVDYYVTYYVLLSEQINAEALWGTAASDGWRASSAPRSDWPRMQFYLSMSLTNSK